MRIDPRATILTGLLVVVSDRSESRHEAAALADGIKTRSVHHTSGRASIVNPGKRPNFDEIQTTLPRGETGTLSAIIDLDAAAQYRNHRRNAGLLPTPKPRENH